MWSHPLQIPLGLTVWAIWFGALYGGLSLGCALAPPPAASGLANWLTATLGAASAIVVGLLLWFSWRCLGTARQGGPEARFVARLAAGAHLVAAIATLFIALPLLRVPPCV